MFLSDMKHFTLHHYQRKMEQEKEELKSYIENDSKTMKEKLDKVRLFINPKILCQLSAIVILFKFVLTGKRSFTEENRGRKQKITGKNQV